MSLKDNIQIRTDSSTNFNLANISLFKGEMAHESDTGRNKLGDGSLLYQSLGYMDQIGPRFLKPYTVAQAEAIATTSLSGMVWVSDETGGAQPAYSDGTNFRRFSNGAIIS